MFHIIAMWWIPKKTEMGYLLLFEAEEWQSFLNASEDRVTNGGILLQKRH